MDEETSLPFEVLVTQCWRIGPIIALSSEVEDDRSAFVPFLLRDRFKNSLQCYQKNGACPGTP